MSHLVTRHHDISCGHRVVGHEGKCRFLHGHNYRVTFTCQADQKTEPLDHIGRVIDFGDIKERLCMWLENNWDHKFLAWVEDPMLKAVCTASEYSENVPQEQDTLFFGSFVWVPFNPTAENMAQYLVEIVGPAQLHDTGITLVHCLVEETRKCSASFGKK